MRVELLWWAGCPSHPAAKAELEAALEELGLVDEVVAMVEIRDEPQARERGFLGSPSIHVDGADLFPARAGDQPGLTCRVYRLDGGRISPTPDPARLRAALRQAIQERSTA